MKIQQFSNDVSLVYEDTALVLKQGSEVLVSDVFEVGIEANGLLPISFDKGSRWAYLDTTTVSVINVPSVQWISGFHFVGNGLNYMGLNYRTDPLTRVPTELAVSTAVESVALALQQIEGVSAKHEAAKKFNYDTQKFEEESVFRITFTENAWHAGLQAIRHIRIVGHGVINSNIDIAKSFVKDETEVVYRPRKMSLSQSSAKYGVINVLTGDVLVPCDFKDIHVYPTMIVAENQGELQEFKF